VSPLSALGYILLWSYALFGLLYLLGKSYRRPHVTKMTTSIPTIDESNTPVSKQSLDKVFEDIQIYSI